MRIPAEQNYHHDRPDWAIVSVDEFRRVQLQMEERRGRYQTFSGHTACARYSTRHLFSTLIKCEHCGKSFCRRTYTYANTREYWICSTNSQYTAGQCDNLVKIEEPELLAQLQAYLDSLIRDKGRFIQGILGEAGRRRREAWDPAGAGNMERERKRLRARQARYQEMYANGVMTMAELKAKTAQTAGELAALDESLKRLEQSAAIQRDCKNLTERYVKEIERFLKLETATNLDLRRIIDHISVNRDGTARIILKRLDDADAAQSLPSWCQ